MHLLVINLILTCLLLVSLILKYVFGWSIFCPQICLWLVNFVSKTTNNNLRGILRVNLDFGP